MDRYYKTVRQYAAEDKERIFERALCVFSDGDAPPNLKEAYLKLLEPPAEGAGNEEALIYFPCYFSPQDTFSSAGCIYRVTDIVSKYACHIQYWDELCSEGLANGKALQKVSRMKPEVRSAVAKMDGTRLPTPVKWESVRDPAGVWIADIRDAGDMLAWAFQDRFGTTSEYIPAKLAGLENKDTVSGPQLFEELQRYIAFKRHALLFMVDKQVREFRETHPQMLEDEEDPGRDTANL